MAYKNYQIYCGFTDNVQYATMSLQPGEWSYTTSGSGKRITYLAECSWDLPSGLGYTDHTLESYRWTISDTFETTVVIAAAPAPLIHRKVITFRVMKLGEDYTLAEKTAILHSEMAYEVSYRHGSKTPHIFSRLAINAAENNIVDLPGISISADSWETHQVIGGSYRYSHAFTYTLSGSSKFGSITVNSFSLTSIGGIAPTVKNCVATRASVGADWVLTFSFQDNALTVSKVYFATANYTAARKENIISKLKSDSKILDTINLANYLNIEAYREPSPNSTNLYIYTENTSDRPVTVTGVATAHDTDNQDYTWNINDTIAAGDEFEFYGQCDYAISSWTVSLVYTAENATPYTYNE